jgi:hypothetical protein
MILKKKTYLVTDPIMKIIYDTQKENIFSNRPHNEEVTDPIMETYLVTDPQPLLSGTYPV